MTATEAVTAAREVRSQINVLEIQLAVARERRNELVRELVRDHGFTWREAAKQAGIQNPYIAHILRSPTDRGGDLVESCICPNDGATALCPIHGIPDELAGSAV